MLLCHCLSSAQVSTLHPLNSCFFSPSLLSPSFPPLGETKGIGIIELSSEEEAKKAVAALNGQEILGRWVAVRKEGRKGGREGGREGGCS
jgi:RNA recognition motif-containing protein